MSEWQPIETAPRDGTPVLCYYPPEGGDDGVCEVYSSLGDGYYEFLLDGRDPTHWMPLPDPPNSVENSVKK